MTADLGVSVVSGPAVVGSGDPVSYQVEVTNVGTQPIAADVLFDEVGLHDVEWHREFHFGNVNAGGHVKGTIGFQFAGSDSLESVGRSVHSAGDVNGDGLDDFIVGATGLFRDLEVSNDFVGGAYVVFGSSDARNMSRTSTPGVFESLFLDGTNGFQLRGFETVDGQNVGIQVSGGRDVNGDGLDDVIIGAPLADQAGEGRGEAYVVFGAEEFPPFLDLNELDGTNGFTILGEKTDDHAGGSVALVEDINDDGLDDIIVGAPGYSEDLKVLGAAYAIFGKSSFDQYVGLADLEASDGFAIYGPTVNLQLGYDVARAGDVNGDGISDLIVASVELAPLGPPGSFDPNPETEAYLIFGSNNGFDNINLAELDGLDGVRFNDGFYVDSAGDFNGDGFDDVLIANHLVFGAPDWLPHFDLDDLNGSNGFEIPRNSLFFGTSGLGDVNGDGLDDLIIGRSSDGWFDPKTPNAEGQGRAYVVYGSSSVPNVLDLEEISGAAGFVINGQFNHEGIANDVSEAGDINGDGISDILVAGDTVNPPVVFDCEIGTCRAESAGVVYVVYGRTSVAGGQGETHDSVVIAPGDSASYTINAVTDGVSEVSLDVALVLRDEVVDQDPSNNSVHFSTQVVGPILGDIDLDGEVAFADFLILGANFGKGADATPSEGDLNGDSAVDFADFLILSANFGRTQE